MTLEQRVAELELQNAELTRDLTAAKAVAHALAAGEVDAVIDEAGATPILLRAAQDELRERQQVLRAIFDGALDAMLLADDVGRYVDANPAAWELFGLPKEQLVGRSILDFAPPGYAQSAEWATFAQKGHLRGELPLMRPDGTRRTLELSAAANIIPGLHLSVLRDVSDRKQQDEALRETQRLLEEAQAVAEVGGWVAQLDPDAPVYWSKESYRIAGLTNDTPLTVNRLFEQVVHPDDRAAVQQAFRAANAANALFESEHRLVRPDGETRWVCARGRFERDANGAPLRVIGTMQDITERRRVLDRLSASEGRYRRIVETTSEGVWLSDASYLTTFVNQPMADMLGYTRDEMVGQTVFMCLTDQGRARAIAKFELRRRGGSSDTYENCYRRKDGTTLWALARTNPIFDENGEFAGTVGLLTNMTERRQFEEARNQLAAIVESSHDAIFSRSLSGTVTSWNRAAAELFGYTTEEIIGQPNTILLPADRQSEVLGILARVCDGKSVDLDTARVRKDGSLVEVSVLASPIRNSEGAVIGASLIARDITDRRENEALLQRSHEQLRQSQKMEAIGVLAGGVAHDFNNILSVILSYTTMVIDDLKPNDPSRADLEEVHTAGLRAADLTRQLLAFSRQQVLQPAVLDLTEIVGGLQRMLVRVLGEDILLSVLDTQRVGMVYADAGQIEQVLMNLVVNARDATPRGGSVTIELSNAILDAEYAKEHPEVTPGRYVMISVTDTGTGMDRPTRERMFDPFFTTKEEGKGTGLGLSTVHGIVQQSGGHIRVFSELGVGTTFKVYLPRTDREAESTVPAVPTAFGSFRGSETILLVEDEDQVRTVVRSILRKQGYNVLEAQNGGEAFLIAEKFVGTIHLLLTDVVMPRMSGREVAERLVPTRKDMRVLFVSGYTKDTTVHHAALEAGVAFLSKPLTPESLAKKVREVLDTPARSP